MKRGLCRTLFLSSLLVGCATSSPLPVGTLVLAQVAHVATRDDMVRGVTVDNTPLVVPSYLLRRCALDAKALESGDLAVLRTWVSKVNQTGLWWVVVPRGMCVKSEDFVEVELKAGLDNHRCSTIARVRSASKAGGDCRFVQSPRGAKVIRCDGLEADGWRKHQDPDADLFDEAVIWRKAPAR